MLRVAVHWQVFGTLEKGKRELPKPSISGKWDEGLWAEMEDGSHVELWRPAPPPPDPTRYDDATHAAELTGSCDAHPAVRAHVLAGQLSLQQRR